jgi:ABC-2 type transport system permease protein
MRALARELRFLARAPSALGALVLLTVVAAASVALGLADVRRQQAAIAGVLALQAVEEAAVRQHAADAGSAAYYTFLPTWSEPSDLAFAALGQRDVAPFLLRVRALALEGQLYESEAVNPELALPGRFDFAFVLVFLAPLVLIALLHDLVSGEREAGRLATLRALSGSTRRLWAARAAVRAVGVLVALAVPLGVGIAVSGTAPARVAGALAIVAGTVAFWTAACVLVASRDWRSSVAATALAAAWFVLTLIVPAAAHLAVNAAVPIPSGAAIARDNREAVHDAWDRPRQPTLARFYASHPQWSHSAPIAPTTFHWKWYFAFQQLGDEHVAERSRAYRDGIARREAAAGVVGVLVPPIGLQRALHRLAGTDVRAQLEYLDRVRAYHAELRGFYYPYLFDERPFGPADWERLPRWPAPPPTRTPPAASD